MYYNILFAIPTAKLSGGAERVIFNLARYLVLNNQNVTVVTMSRGFQKGWDELEIHNNFKWIIGNYPSEKSSLIPITLKLIKLDNSNNYDYVFSSHIQINSYLNTLKSLGLFSNAFLISRESTMVFKRNTNYKKYLYMLVYKFLYGNQDLLICQTESMKESLLKNLSFSPTKNIEVIPNPINIQYIKSRILEPIDNEFNNKKYIVACGRLIKLKQFDLLIEAFNTIHSIFPNYNLIIIGDGIEKENLLKQVKRLNLDEYVFLTGNVDNPFSYFSHAEIGVVSSKIEGFPNVLIEMMASGIKKIVSTPCTDAVKNIPNIFVTKDSSAKQIAISLKEAIESDKEYVKEYESYIINKHSIENFWNSIVNLS